MSNKWKMTVPFLFTSFHFSSLKWSAEKLIQTEGRKAIDGNHLQSIMSLTSNKLVKFEVNLIQTINLILLHLIVNRAMTLSWGLHSIVCHLCYIKGNYNRNHRDCDILVSICFLSVCRIFIRSHDTWHMTERKILSHV